MMYFQPGHSTCEQQPFKFIPVIPAKLVLLILLIISGLICACNPQAVIEANPLDVCVGEPVHFDASKSTDLDNDIASYTWDFGDGTGQEGSQAEHAYAAVGDYNVKLTVMDAKNNSSTAQKVVRVFGSVTAAISADPSSVMSPGDKVTLSWDTSNAASVSLSPDVGSVALNGSQDVSISQATTYTLTAEGPCGTATESVEVTVIAPPPVIDVFTAASGTEPIQQGAATTLQWSCTNAAFAHITPGIGEVNPNGSCSVSPLATTTYNLMATGEGGAASTQVTVRVTCDKVPLPEGSFGEQYQDLIPPDSTVGEYDAKRFSVITGLVHDRNDLPLSDVSVTVLNHPEYGTAITDAGGRFSLPVEGGNTLTLVYKKEDFFPLQRQLSVMWNDINMAETIVMVQADPVSTTLVFKRDSDAVIMHKGSESIDMSGSRSSTLVFTGDTTAYAVDENGTDIQRLPDILTVRSTEYTVGENGPRAMPAELPPNVAYTYCVDLQVEGVERVRFDKPVINWVDNFLGFEVGTNVPCGYYNKDQGIWIPQDNGIVVRLLDYDPVDGIVDALDSDGDGYPNDLNNNMDYTDEVRGLTDSQTYQPDTTYWRVELSHFSPLDYNWAWGAPEGGTPPNPPRDPYICDGEKTQTDSEEELTLTACFVKNQSQVFHENIALPDTDFALHYSSSRATGYKHLITVTASGSTVPSPLKRIEVEMKLAGRSFTRSLEPLPNQVVEFEWDGKDYLGNMVAGSAIATIHIGYVYQGVRYDIPDVFGATAFRPTSPLLRNPGRPEGR